MIVTTGVVYQLAKIKNFGVSYLTPFAPGAWQQSGGEWVLQGAHALHQAPGSVSGAGGETEAEVKRIAIVLCAALAAGC